MALQDRCWSTSNLNQIHCTTPWFHWCCDHCRKELVKELVRAQEEFLGRQAPPLKPHGKMWDKNKMQSPPGQRYTSGRRVNRRGRVQDQPSCQKQTSLQLVFSVMLVCKEYKPAVVICEAFKHWDGNLRWCCTCVILFSLFYFIFTFTKIHYSCTTDNFSVIDYQWYVYVMCDKVANKHI